MTFPICIIFSRHTIVRKSLEVPFTTLFDYRGVRNRIDVETRKKASYDGDDGAE